MLLALQFVFSVTQTFSLSPPDLKNQLFSFWSLHRHLKYSVPETELPSPAFLLPVSKQHHHLPRCSSQTHRSLSRFIPYDPPPTVNTSLEFISKVFSSLCLCCYCPTGDTIPSYLVTALVFHLRLSLPLTFMHSVPPTTQLRDWSSYNIKGVTIWFKHFCCFLLIPVGTFPCDLSLSLSTSPPVPLFPAQCVHLGESLPVHLHDLPQTGPLPFWPLCLDSLNG